MTPEERSLAQELHLHQQQLFREALERGEDMEKAMERIRIETYSEWRKLLSPDKNEANA